VLGTADPEKRCSKIFSADHCTLLQAQNKDQLRAMSRADWLSTAAAKIVRDLANGQSEMMSEQVAKSLKEVQLLNVEAAQTRKEVLSSLVVSHVNMKMSRRESLLKGVLPSFAKHSMDLMRLPLDSNSLFPEGNKVIASWTGKVQLATLAALANPTRPQVSAPGKAKHIRPMASAARARTVRPYPVKSDSYYKSDKGSYNQKPRTQQSFRGDPKRGSSSAPRRGGRGRGAGGRGQARGPK